MTITDTAATSTPMPSDASATVLPTPVAEIAGAQVAYGDNTVLDDVSLQISPGEIVALIGRSGSGKSTLLRLLAGLSIPEAGSSVTAGSPAVAFQEPRLLPWRTVRKNVSYGLTRVCGLRRNEIDDRVRIAVTEVGLDEKLDAWPAALSGGQAQRVSLARALIAEPRLLLLDEPFGALDALTRAAMHRLLVDLWRQHRFGVLMVTHDVDEALALADRVAVLANGRIAAEIDVPDPRPADGRGDVATLRSDLLDALGARV